MKKPRHLFRLAKTHFGGRDRFIHAANALMDRLDAPEARMTQRLYYSWNDRGIGTEMRIWIAATCVEHGVPIEEVRKIYPRIDVAVRLAEILCLKDAA